MQRGRPATWKALFGRHARTFRFAARLFPAEQAALVRGLYAYCRFTDDLVDEADPALAAAERGARLDAWRMLTREAFEGRPTGVPLLDACSERPAAGASPGAIPTRSSPASPWT